MTRRAAALALAATAAVCPATIEAHAFTQPYILPVPLWIYLYACAAILVVSFAAMGYFLGAADTVPAAWTVEVTADPIGRAAGRIVLGGLRAGAVAALLVTIGSGFAGSADPYANINITLFWIVFLLMFTYLTAIAGDLFQAINPWRAIVDAAERIGGGSAEGRLAYPARLAYWPAVAWYVALIWLELFVLPQPRVLSIAVLLYTMATCAGAWLFGKAAWFRYADLFGVFFRLVGTLAPVAYAEAGDGTWRVRLRRPFDGILAGRADHISLLVFVLFMLSSTTYDGVHDTVMWVGLYWRHVARWLQPLWGADLVAAQEPLTTGYVVYQRASLIVSPFLYLGIYLLVVRATKAATRTAMTLPELAQRFAFSLVPIAFVYNVTHYYTIVMTQARTLPLLASDPLGLGWNLLRLGPPGQPPPIDMGAVWHTQVALVLAGHVVSVWLAHAIALRTFPSRRQALVSQLPMLVLMVIYTGLGLAVLSLPLAVGG